MPVQKSARHPRLHKASTPSGPNAPDTRVALASFGAPIALEDHALRACYAALDMQEAARVCAADIRREFGMLFEIRQKPI